MEAERVEGKGSEVVSAVTGSEPVKAAPEERRAIRRRRKMEAMCDEYLRSLHCTLWGQPFEIISVRGRAEAVAWLVDTLEGLAEQERAKAIAIDIKVQGSGA